MSVENYLILIQPRYDIILLDAKMGIRLQSDILEENFPLGAKPPFEKNAAQPAWVTMESQCPVTQRGAAKAA